MVADKNTEQKASSLGRGLIIVGIAGAALAAVCCFAPFILGGVIAAVGLGFILKDSILMGLLIAFSGLGVLGAYLIQRKQARRVNDP